MEISRTQDLVKVMWNPSFGLGVVVVVLWPLGRREKRNRILVGAAESRKSARQGTKPWKAVLWELQGSEDGDRKK